VALCGRTRQSRCCAVVSTARIRSDGTLYGVTLAEWHKSSALKPLRVRSIQGKMVGWTNTSLSSTLNPHVQPTSRQSHHTSSIRFDVDKDSRFFFFVVLFRFVPSRKAIGLDDIVDIVSESLTPRFSCHFFIFSILETVLTHSYRCITRHSHKQNKRHG
jgi:hypothetical protein